MEWIFTCPKNPLRIECYVDADFAGLFTAGEKQDPVSVQSRTGYEILNKGAPLLWVT
jgi:hypothetical protein